MEKVQWNQLTKNEMDLEQSKNHSASRNEERIKTPEDPLLPTHRQGLHPKTAEDPLLPTHRQSLHPKTPEDTQAAYPPPGSAPRNSWRPTSCLPTARVCTPKLVKTH